MYKLVPGHILPDGRKAPLIRDWQALATNDQAQLRRWSEAFGERLTHWIIPTGPINNILVLDIDVKSKANGFQTIKDLGLYLPETQSQSTLSGGMHCLFKYPNDGKRYGNKVGFHPGLDIRGDGGYIVHYKLNGSPIVDAPDWVLKDSIKPLIDNSGPSIGVAPSIAEGILLASLEAIREAAQGERNDTLNKESFRIGQLVASKNVTLEHAQQVLFQAALEIGVPDYEAKSTIKSGLEGGMAKPMTTTFGEPVPSIYIPPVPQSERWTPKHFTRHDLLNMSKLKKPQLFKDWSSEDIHITTADGGTGKTTLKLYEAICLALGERFLGFNCLQPGAKTLFITGEDTAAKLGAMLGAIMTQMGIINDAAKVATVLSCVLVKKDSDLCLITKDKQGFLQPNEQAMDSLLQAVHDIKPKMIVFDPISSFWGSEAALNDMAKAVSRFMQRLTEESGACVEMINHMGKQSSQNRDMSQFAGRGGTGLPSHSRVSRVLRTVFDEEYTELTGQTLDENQSAMMCNVSKFSDGSPLLNNPFLIVREGFLFRRITLDPVTQRDEIKRVEDTERVFTFIEEERKAGKYPTKRVIIARFMLGEDKFSEARVKRTLDVLIYEGHGGKLVREVENPDVLIRDRVFVITDLEGNEL